MIEQGKLKIVKAETKRAELTLLHEKVSASPEFARMCLQFTDAPLIAELIQRNPERAREFLRRLGHSVKAAA